MSEKSPRKKGKATKPSGKKKANREKRKSLLVVDPAPDAQSSSSSPTDVELKKLKKDIKKITKKCRLEKERAAAAELQVEKLQEQLRTQGSRIEPLPPLPQLPSDDEMGIKEHVPTANDENDGNDGGQSSVNADLQFEFEKLLKQKKESDDRATDLQLQLDNVQLEMKSLLEQSTRQAAEFEVDRADLRQHCVALQNEVAAVNLKFEQTTAGYDDRVGQLEAELEAAKEAAKEAAVAAAADDELLSPRPPPPPPEDEEDGSDDTSDQASAESIAEKLAAALERVDQLEVERDLHCDRADAAESRLAELQKKLNSVQLDHAKSIDTISRQLTELQEQAQNNSGELDLKLRRVEEQLQAASERADRAEAECALHCDRADEAEAKIASMQQKLSGQESSHARLKAQVAELQRSLEQQEGRAGPSVAVSDQRQPIQRPASLSSLHKGPVAASRVGGGPTHVLPHAGIGRASPPASPVLLSRSSAVQDGGPPPTAPRRMASLPTGIPAARGPPPPVPQFATRRLVPASELAGAVSNLHRARSSTEPPRRPPPSGPPPSGPPPSGPPPRPERSRKTVEAADDDDEPPPPPPPQQDVQRLPEGRVIKRAVVRNDIPAREQWNSGKVDKKLSHLHGVWGGCGDRNEEHKSYMEDSHVEVPDLLENYSLFAVLDGHSGREAVDYVTENLATIVKACLESQMEPQAALSHAFTQLDLELAELEITSSGCTAVVVLIHSVAGSKNRELFVANVGDARAVLSTEGSKNKALRLSYDHKATDPAERARVEADGAVLLWDKVQGQLAVTRALGDHDLKKWVINEPYQSHVSINKSHNYIVLACDGIFDVVTDQQVVEIVGKNGQKNPQKAAAKLLDEVKKKKSTDNLCATIIAL